MTTWVLVLTIPVSAIATVPGYQSRAQCIAAGQAFVTEAGWGTKAGYRCIPGPTVRQREGS
jgi:hypothetical protein